MYNTDGNLAALNAWQREQDEIEAGELHLEKLQQELADDIYDAYITGSENAVNEVEDALTDTQTMGNLLGRLRAAMEKECQRPVMGRGGEVYDTYWRLLDAVCLDIAKRCTTPDELDQARRFYGV
jgi:hypothetical protein